MRRWRQPGATARQGILARNPAWPVTALLAGYPLWWLLGLADFMWIMLAIPMAFRMAAWAAHGTRRIVGPRRASASGCCSWSPPGPGSWC